MLEEITEVMRAITDGTLAVMDWLLGWLLDGPTDLAIAVVAVATSILLVGVRRWTTDQDLLARVAHDKRRLKELARDTQQLGDRDAARRFRDNRSTIALHSLPRLMRGEALTLIVSLAPIALLATWCYYRLEFHPPRAGEAIEIALQSSVSAVGQVAHLVPQEGLSVDGGWVRAVEVVDVSPPRGSAVWTLRAEGRPTPYRLVLRVGDQSFEHPLVVGQRHYAPPRVEQGDGFATEVRLREVKLFNRLPGVRGLYLPAWMLGYLGIAVGMTWVLKRWWGVY